jgi:hypothetical protein
VRKWRRERSEAVAGNSLLNQSSVDRGLLGPALGGVTNCQDVYGGESTIERVATDRRQELAQLNALNTHALPSGTVSALAAALSFSARSDQEFAAWARDVEGYYGCSRSYVPTDSHYSNGQVFSEQATQAKNRFVSRWNRLAARFGLPYRNAGGI